MATTASWDPTLDSVNPAYRRRYAGLTRSGVRSSSRGTAGDYGRWAGWCRTLPPMDPRPRIALLIDADNARASKIDLILNELSAYGETSIRRAYGNWTKPGLKSWAALLHSQAIRPVQQYDYSRGKNASDMAMVVDAMSLLYNDHPDAFGIV